MFAGAHLKLSFVEDWRRFFLGKMDFCNKSKYCQKYNKFLTVFWYNKKINGVRSMIELNGNIEILIFVMVVNA